MTTPQYPNIELLEFKARIALNQDEVYIEKRRAAKKQNKNKPIYLEAQVYAKALYEKQGFRQISDVFLLDGIPHIKMLRDGML